MWQYNMVELADARNLQKIKEELIRESQANIKGTKSAKSWLIKSRLIVKDKHHSMNIMASTLFQLSSGNFPQPKEMINGMQAIVFCMEEIIQTQ
jgi:hypothetical protein